jgi:hypothetical protein
LTIREALTIHRRADLANLATWMAGFAYPATAMRALWADVEEGQWIDALEFAAGGSFRQADTDLAVDALRAWMVHADFRSGLSPETVNVLARTQFDPDFDPIRNLTASNIKAVAKDLPVLFNNPGIAALDPRWLWRLVPLGLGLMHEHLAPLELAKTIRGLSPMEVETIHADTRFLLAPLRIGLHEAIVSSTASRENEQAALWVFALPRLMWGVGGMIMIADLGLRRSGYSDQVDETIGVLRKIASDPIYAAQARAIATTLRSAIAKYPDDEAALSMEVDRQFASFAPSHEADLVAAELGQLVEIWKPVVVRWFQRIGGQQSISAGIFRLNADASTPRPRVSLPPPQPVGK